MAILNYTTTIQAEKTLGEIHGILSKAGATKIMTDYEEKIPVAISFQIKHNASFISFRLPCNFVGIKNSMRKSRVPTKLQTNEQAVRVGWRIIKDWIGAQLAIVESELAEMPEVFLPYALYKDGNTIYNHIKESGQNQYLLTT